jgi:hypothetical protein
MMPKSCCLFGSFQLAAKTPATDSQTAQRRVERLGRVDDFAIRDRCNSLNAQINAIDLVRRAMPIALRIRHFDLYCYKPTIRRARDRRAQDRSCEAQFLGHGDVADLGEADRLAVQTKLVVGNIKAVAATPFF